MRVRRLYNAYDWAKRHHPEDFLDKEFLEAALLTAPQVSDKRLWADDLAGVPCRQRGG
jgi:hypothetical protein